MPLGLTLEPLWRESKRESDQDCGMLVNAELRSLSARRASPQRLKGGIARATGSTKWREGVCLFCLLSPCLQIRMEVDRHLESSFLRRATVDSFFKDGDRPLVPQWGRHVGTLDTSVGTIWNSWPVDGSSVSTVARLSAQRRCSF